MTEYVIERVRVVAENTTLPLLIWRRFQRPMPGLVEDTMARNPGLSSLGAVLPVGTEFDLKIDVVTAPTGATQTQEAIRLW